jgi:hypothetical protein
MPKPKLSFRTAKQQVRDLGLTLVNNREWNEFIVKVPWNRPADYHTSDLQDAVDTAIAIAKEREKERKEEMRNVKTPRFQQRHYEAIAECVSNYVEDNEMPSKLLTALCAMFKADNPKFNRDKFMLKCSEGMEKRGM